MAIYSFHIEAISRGNAGNKIAKSGKSIVAMAAYRSGERLADERTGIIYDYSEKQGVVHAEIMAPENASAWVYKRELLWNEVEKVEIRANANLGRQVVMALPKELNREQQIELIREYLKNNFVDKGMVVDFAIHDKGDNNPHCHALITRRELNKNSFGEVRKEWVGGDFKGRVSEERKAIINELRSSWAEYANRSLERSGYSERIDHRSYKDQGVDKVAQIHLGPNVKALQDKGIHTERAAIYNEIKEVNSRVEELKREKVVVLNQYRAAKAEDRKLNGYWKDFTPEEKAKVIQAKDVLKKYATFENIEKGYGFVDQKIQFWNGLEEKLSRKMLPFHNVATTINRLQDSREQYKESPLFSKERQELKEQIIKLESDFQKGIERLQKYVDYGIRNESSFEKVYSKMMKEAALKQENYQKSKKSWIDKREILDNAKAAIKEVECKKFIKDYPQYAEYQYFNKSRDFLSSNDAYLINDLNRMAGKKLSLEEIRAYGDKANSIIEETKRLDRVKSALNDYDRLIKEKQKLEGNLSQIKRLFSQESKKEYEQVLLKLDRVKETLKNNKVVDREDYQKQTENLKKDIFGLPSVFRNQAIKQKENEINSKNYQLYRQEERFKQANDILQELKESRKIGLFSFDRANIKQRVESLEKAFEKCKVGSEKEFNKAYAAMKIEIEGKRKDLERQRQDISENIEMTKILEKVSMARNAVVDIQNKAIILKHYEKGKAVNEIEYRAGINEGSHRGDPEADRRTRAISSPGDRHLEGTSNQSIRHNASVEGAEQRGLSRSDRGLQQDSGSGEHSIENRRRTVLETTTGRIKEGIGADDKQQGRDNPRAETNDREVSSKDRGIFSGKDKNSSSSSRLKSNFSAFSHDRSGTSSSLDAELKDLMKAQIQEMKRLEKEKVKEEEKEKGKQAEKAKNKDRER